jgi:hypothetical protein
MAGPSKRASMREGPLAALFRKTEDGEVVDQPELPHPALKASSEVAPEPTQDDSANVPTPRE